MELISLKAAAHITKEKPATLRRLVAQKKIEVLARPRRKPMIIKSSLMAYYQEKVITRFHHQLPVKWTELRSYRELLYRVHKLKNYSPPPKKRKSWRFSKVSKVEGFLTLFFMLCLILFSLFFYWSEAPFILWN